MFEFSASELGMEAAADGSWGFGEGDFTVTGWLSPGETFATGVEDPDKDWANFFAKADPGPGRLQYGAFASLYSDHRIRFGVEDFPDSRLEVTCGDSCVPRAECADDPVVQVGGLKGRDASVGVADCHHVLEAENIDQLECVHSVGVCIRVPHRRVAKGHRHRGNVPGSKVLRPSGKAIVVSQKAVHEEDGPRRRVRAIGLHGAVAQIASALGGVGSVGGGEI